MPRSTLSRHDLPDAAAHLDWFIERDTPGTERRLLTFRLPLADPPFPLSPASGPTQATRLPDHRAVYLEHQGPVSGGRGTLLLIATGPAAILFESSSLIRFECALDGRARTFEATPLTGDLWTIAPVPPTRPPP